MEAREERHFAFGLFRAYPDRGELWKGSRRIPLQDLPFRLLLLLLEHGAEVVTREELQNAMWPNSTYGDFDDGVHTAVKKVRRALGDSASNPCYVETVQRRGYRFVAPIAFVESRDEPGKPESLERKTGGRRLIMLPIGFGSLALLMLSAAWLFLIRSNQGLLEAPVPFTSYSGTEVQPTFSPDGNRVAFAWNGEGQQNFDIYLKQIGEEQPVRLTTDPAKDFGPAWSRDGRFIAFGRLLTPGKAGIFIIPATGGVERKLTETEAPHQRKPDPFLAWSPDNRWLVISETMEPGTLQEHRLLPASLVLFSVETGERRKLTFPEPGALFDAAPAFSPDGRNLAFIRALSWSVTDLFLLHLTGNWRPSGEPIRLTSWNRATSGPAWVQGGREIVVGSGRWDSSTLWRVGVSPSVMPRRLEFAVDGAESPTIAGAGRLVYSQRSVDVNIWHVELAHGGGVTRKSERLIASTRTDMFPQFSPDGSRMLYLSDRTGHVEIWTASPDGSNSRQVTSMKAPIVGAPRWSPDGKRIVFDSNHGGRWEIYQVALAGGVPRQMTDDLADECCASWSRDGRSIYFMSSRSGQRQIWKMPSNGGRAVQITKHGGHVGLESPDGRFVYYTTRGPEGERDGNGGLWRVPATGGEEVRILPSVTFYNFALHEDGIYFIPQPTLEGTAVYFYPFTGGAPRMLARVGEVHPGLSISADGRRLMYSQVDERRSDLMLLNDFR